MTHAHIYGDPACTCPRCNGSNPAYTGDAVILPHKPADAMPAFPAGAHGRKLCADILAAASRAFGTEVTGLVEVSSRYAILQRVGDSTPYAVEVTPAQAAMLGYMPKPARRKGGR